MPAFEVRILVTHRPMQRSDFAHLIRHVDMAGGATVGHGHAIPRRNVTGLALPARLRVRGHPAQRLARLRVERPGAIKDAALPEGHPRDDTRCDQRGNNSSGRKATQS